MSSEVDDDLWSAIGDPTRRRLLDLLLREGGGTASSLGRQLPVTRQAVAKHLGVLDRVGLVTASAAGREKRYRVDDDRLGRAAAQLAAVGSAWDARLQRIKGIAESIEQARQAPPNTSHDRGRRSEDDEHPAQDRCRECDSGEGV